MLLCPDEMDKEEFRTLTRPLWPAEWTDADFEAAWNEFQAMKAAKRLH